MANTLTNRRHIVQDPPLAERLFADTRMAWLWLPIRLWLGWHWLEAGWHKVTDPAWVSGGQALQGFWTRAVQVEEGARPTIAFGWYRDFLEGLLNSGSYTWFAPLIAWGEVLIGVALILGAFTGIAAFFGAFLNWNFLMAGTASTNGMMLVLTVGLILAWKIAGWIGLDRFLLPLVGTPWNRRDYVEPVDRDAVLT